MTPPSSPAPRAPSRELDANDWLASADRELAVVERVARTHLPKGRGALHGAPRDATATVPLVDLLTIVCAASSAQQAVRRVSELLEVSDELSELEAMAFATLQERAAECHATDGSAPPRAPLEGE